MTQTDELPQAEPKSMDVTSESIASPFPAVREVPAGRPLRWLAQAVGDMRSCSLPSLLYGLCFAVMALLLTTVFRHAYEYISALISGFLLVGPVFAMGLYEISRRHELELPCSLGPTLAVWRRNISNIGIFALILGIIFLVWARASLVIFALFYTSELPSLSRFLGEVASFDNSEFLMVYFGVGLIFATLVFALSVVSIPLMLDRNQDAITAMITSVAALLKNPFAMMVWGALIVALTIVGFVTFYLGLIVIIPLIGHATWHAYRDIVEIPESVA